MLSCVTPLIDSLADQLEEKGLTKEAYQLDVIANTLEQYFKEAIEREAAVWDTLARIPGVKQVIDKVKSLKPAEMLKQLGGSKNIARIHQLALNFLNQAQTAGTQPQATREASLFSSMRNIKQGVMAVVLMTILAGSIARIQAATPGQLQAKATQIEQSVDTPGPDTAPKSQWEIDHAKHMKWLQDHDPEAYQQALEEEKQQKIQDSLSQKVFDTTPRDSTGKPIIGPGEIADEKGYPIPDPKIGPYGETIRDTGSIDLVGPHPHYSPEQRQLWTVLYPEDTKEDRGFDGRSMPSPEEYLQDWKEFRDTHLKDKPMTYEFLSDKSVKDSFNKYYKEKYPDWFNK